MRRLICAFVVRIWHKLVFSWRGSNHSLPVVINGTERRENRWAATWQNHQNGCAPSEDSDQPGHPASLIRVFAVRLKKAWVLSYPLSTQRKLIRLGGCLGWSESSLGAHSFRWFCHVVAQIMTCINNENARKKSFQANNLVPINTNFWECFMTSWFIMHIIMIWFLCL